ncbi:hypothetical protein AAC387_Pa09g1018 [Persea americana]
MSSWWWLFHIILLWIEKREGEGDGIGDRWGEGGDGDSDQSGQVKVVTAWCSHSNGGDFAGGRRGEILLAETNQTRDNYASKLDDLDS